VAVKNNDRRLDDERKRPGSLSCTACSGAKKVVSMRPRQLSGM
jgi:hypothetical protein